MIRFSEYLAESRSAPLYHATTLQNAISIIEGGGIYGGWESKISTTRSLSFARRWWNFDGEAKKKNQENVIFVLDQDAISRRYKIVPYDYYDEIGNIKAVTIGKRGTKYHSIYFDEQEEIIYLGKNDKYLSLKYVTKILISRELFNKYKNLKNNSTKREPIYYDRFGNSTYGETLGVALYRLLHHPLTEILN